MFFDENCFLSENMRLKNFIYCKSVYCVRKFKLVTLYIQNYLYIQDKEQYHTHDGIRFAHIQK